MKLLKGVVLSEGCILDYDVQLGPEVVIPAHTRIISELIDDGFGSEDEDESVNGESNTEMLGFQAHGFVYTDHLLEDDDEVDMRNIERGYLGYETPEETDDSEYDSAGETGDESRGFTTEEETGNAIFKYRLEIGSSANARSCVPRRSFS